jgi:hypothetical protein
MELAHTNTFFFSLAYNCPIIEESQSGHDSEQTCQVRYHRCDINTAHCLVHLLPFGVNHFVCVVTMARPNQSLSSPDAAVLLAFEHKIESRAHVFSTVQVQSERMSFRTEFATDTKFTLWLISFAHPKYILI